ncbi:hypothetical protein ONZ45_g13066 [Pleurotus djamor]|nr:hypothetical protein ONZ45_g13066 [Pleurotus djamor]
MFPLEIFLLIVHQLGAQERKHLYPLLSLGKHVSQIVTPLFYEYIVMKAGLVSTNPLPHTTVELTIDRAKLFHRTLAQNTRLASFVQGLIIEPKAVMRYEDDEEYTVIWDTVNNILQLETLINLKSLYASRGQTYGVLTSISQHPHLSLTHLSGLSSLCLPENEPAGLEAAQFPNLHTVDGLPELWWPLIKDNSAPVEHLAGCLYSSMRPGCSFLNDSTAASLMFHHIRTLKVTTSSDTPELVTMLLPHLTQIELLNIYSTDLTNTLHIPLKNLFRVPSSKLKYLHIPFTGNEAVSSVTDPESTPASALLDSEVLFNHFPNLMIVDFEKLYHYCNLTAMLPLEIFLLIIHQLGSQDRIHLYPLLFVNKVLSGITTPLFYEYIIMRAAFVTTDPLPHTTVHLSVETTKLIYRTLSQSEKLVAYVKGLVIEPKLVLRYYDNANYVLIWETVNDILRLETLSNLKSLYATRGPSYLLPSVNQSPQRHLTHLSGFSSLYGQKMLDTLRKHQDSLCFIRTPSSTHFLDNHSSRFQSATFPNLHTLDGIPELWYTLLVDGRAPIEHLAGSLVFGSPAHCAFLNDSTVASLVFRCIRTLKLSTSPSTPTFVTTLLPYLLQIELLSISSTRHQEVLNIPLKCLINIPSRELKYLQLPFPATVSASNGTPPGTALSDTEALFHQFPKLRIIDFEELTHHHAIIHRRTRINQRHDQVLGTLERREPMSKESPQALHQSHRKHPLPAFSPWWEALTEDFEDEGG